MSQKDINGYDNESAESLLETGRGESRSGGIADPEKTKQQDNIVKSPNYSDLQIYKGGNIIAVRINGRNYTSADANVPDDVKEIIRRVSEGEPIAGIYEQFGVKHSRGYGLLGSIAKTTGGIFANEAAIYWIIIIILAAIFIRQITG